MAHRHHYRRRHNPFSAGGIAPLATKVAGGLLGGVGAAVIPNMLGSTMGSGWAGVIAALVVAFGGSYLTKGMSANLSEGVLIGGTLQAAGRIAQLTLGKNLVQLLVERLRPDGFPRSYTWVSSRRWIRPGAYSCWEHGHFTRTRRR